MEPYERLDEAMRRRRLALGMKTWRQLSLAAGISYETLRAVRNGGRPADGTADGLDRALQWEPGSVAAILAGGDPPPAGEPPAETKPAETDSAVADLPDDPAEAISELRRELAVLTAKLARFEERDRKTG